MGHKAMKSTSPPAWAIRFFKWFCNAHLSEAVLGDLLDLYERRRQTIAKWKADLLFVWNVCQFLQPFAVRKPRFRPQTNMSMFKNFMVVATRNMARQKMFTSIKVGGFALGLATCIVIALYIRHEMSFDRHYENTNRIYRVINFMDAPDGGKWTATPAPFTDYLKHDFPEIELAARLIPYKWFNAGSNLLRKDNEAESFYEEGFAYADPDLLQILEIPLVYGSQAAALSQPNSVVISREKADKYFPNEDPVGKIIVLNNDPNVSLTIGGVMENFPSTSHLYPYQFLITLKGKEFWNGEQDSWCCWNYNPYVRLRAGTDSRALETKLLSIKKVYLDYLDKEKNKRLEDVRTSYKLLLQPVKDVHLYSDGIDDIIAHGDIRYIWMFGGIAFFILVLAIINFINLSTARSANRAKEVGMRKVVGSYRISLVHQFLSESILYSVSSFVVALLILVAGIPLFNEISGQRIVVPWTEIWFLPIMVFSAIVVGILAGAYPSFYLSSFRPIDVLKGSVARGFRNSKLRSAMVIFQFTTSIVLIIGTYIIHKQMNFIMNTKVGFEKERVLIVQGVNTLEKQMGTFKEELQTLASVQSVTITEYLPIANTKRDMNSFWREGKSKEEASIGAQAWWVDADYIKTMGMKIVEGRNFQKDLASDSNAVVINQSMVKKFGFKNPIGERIMNWSTWHVVGVVEDFQFENMKEEIHPVVLMRGNWGGLAAVKLSPGDPRDAVSEITKVWNRFMPNQAIRYAFMDDSYEQMYKDVQHAGNIVASFAILAVIVACLGLFALSAFMIEQRNKEISIRLVLGASLQNIFGLLTNQFVKLVCVAFVLATPLSYFIMEKWLEVYKYKTSIGWEIFAVAGLSAILLALVTVSYQAIRAALVNPAGNLRSE